MPTAEEFYAQIPPITKYLAGFSLLLTLLSHFNIVSGYNFLLIFSKIFSRNLQLWRLFTNVFFFGGLSLNFLFNFFFFIQFSSRVEKEDFGGRTADFVYCLLIGIGVMTFGAWLFGVPILSFSFLTYLVYIWCNKHPTVDLGLFFIPVTVKAYWFPWALMLLHVLMGGSPIGDLIGIFAGHLYYFLDVIYPAKYGHRILKTPSFLYSLFPPTTVNVHGFNMGTPPPQQPRFPRAFGGVGRRLGNE